MRTRALSGAILFFTFPLLAATALAAQSVSGRVLDEATDDPIAAVTIQLLDSADHVIAMATSTDEGKFVLNAPQSGRYHLRASRMGYAEATSPPFDLLSNRALEVELRLSTQAIPLAPLTITSARPPLIRGRRLAAWGYYDREDLYGSKGMGAGYFLDEEDLEKRILFDMSDLFRDMPRIHLVHTGGRSVEIETIRGCVPAIFLDGIPFGKGAEALDQIESASVVAVEIYPGMIVPLQFIAPRSIGSCGGAVVVWTGMRNP